MLVPNLKLPGSLSEYAKIESLLESKDRSLVWNVYWIMSRADLWFLMKYVLNTSQWLRDLKGIQHEDFLFKRCREVQADSNRVMDIWARYHWKSTIKTYANVIRMILIDPNVTIGIFSHVRPIAKQFLDQVRREILNNELLKAISWNPDSEKATFPDSDKDYPKISLDEGIIVPSRTSNPREPTMSAWGLVDSMPTGAHFGIRAYDDVVTEKSVNTSDMIAKTLKAYELSLNLGMPEDEAWYTGTFYSHDDTYHEIIKRGAPLRVHPCYELDMENCSIDERTGIFDKMAWHFDRPVLYYRDHLLQKFKEAGAQEGSKTAAMQMLCDANAGLSRGFDREWIKYYHTDPVEEAQGKNKYLLVDPANEKKKTSDYTAMIVFAVGADQNLYVVDMVRDRLSLHERADMVFALQQRWSPIEVRYEKYGLQADIGHIEYLQEHRGYRFPITDVGGIVRKEDRIERLVPLFRSGRIFLPVDLNYVDHQGTRIDLVSYFVEDEYMKFPNSTKVDVLDAMSRIAEPDHPLLYPDPSGGMARMRYATQAQTFTETSWMAM